ncbi:type II toxin-antitoxin system death-on-curing family toxin [Streptomyces radiopugnans]|uniref:type II toxin-antitoxin system death-on-curing family toxin n=1 Tax=Streptomyces radiopugnans TaxID=403935 RepID=UPI000B888830|nr:type II toxin-antitoxin system death-on-curing family toxin [Streptomyces radiopugnans]
MSKAVITLSVDEVLRVRNAMTKMNIASRDFGGNRPLYPDKLESAVSRQTVGYGGQLKYKKLESIAATLFFGLACSHSFENGNKRTALVSMLVLLEKNSASLGEATEQELYDLATDVAAYKKCDRFAHYEGGSDEVVSDVGRWLRSRIRDRRAGFRPMKAGEFLSSLQNLGCEVGPPIKSFIRVTPPPSSSGRVAKIYYGGDGKELSADYIRGIRQQLGLGLADGVDEATFFDLEPAVDRFVQEYSGVLDRLADA